MQGLPSELDAWYPPLAIAFWRLHRQNAKVDSYKRGDPSMTWSGRRLRRKRKPRVLLVPVVMLSRFTHSYRNNSCCPCIGLSSCWCVSSRLFGQALKRLPRSGTRPQMEVPQKPWKIRGSRLKYPKQGACREVFRRFRGAGVQLEPSVHHQRVISGAKAARPLPQNLLAKQLQQRNT